MPGSDARVRTRFALSRRTATVIVAAVLGFAFAQPTMAQARGAASLSLDEAIATSYRGNAQLRQMARTLDAARANVLLAGAAFDPAVQTIVGQSRSGEPTPSQQEFVGLVTDQTSFSVAAPTMLRSGIVLTPQVGITRTGLSSSPGRSVSRASAAVNATLPLWKDVGGAVTRASELAAEHRERGVLADFRHRTAQVTSSVTLAYWGYRAASDRLAIHRAAEARAVRLVQETAALIAADERPASDLVQVQASLAAKRTTRLTAEQAVSDSWRQLATVLGALAPPPTPTTELPHERADDVPMAEGLLDAAVLRRADVVAATERVRASDTQLHAAEREVRPRFDLILGMGYTGATQGRGLNDFFSPLGHTPAGMNVSVQLKYQSSLKRAGARASVLEIDALHEQDLISLGDARRLAALGAASAREALVRAREGLAIGDSAVTLSALAVENVRRKFQLGATTLLDVLAAEDVLTAALIAQVAARQGYAAARVNVAFETGVLAGAGPTPAVPDRAAAPPR